MFASTVFVLAIGAARALSPAGLAALQLDDCKAALDDATPPADDAERVALGRCALEMGQPSRALADLRGVSGGLAPYADLVAGEALLAESRWAEAEARLQRVRVEGAAGRRAAQLRGRALVELERWAEARDVLAPLLDGDFAADAYTPPNGDADPAEVRWWLAEGARRRGEPAKAVPVWRRIWVANPTSPRAGQAEARLLTQGKPVPNPASSEGQQLIAARAASLERLRMYPEALALKDLLPAKPAVRRSPGEAARDAFDAKDYPRAVDLYASLPSPGPSQRFHHALAMSRTGDYAAAARLYTALFEAFPAHKYGDFGSYKVGYLAYDEGDLERAVPLLRAHLDRYPQSRHAEEARWFIAWSLFRLDRLEASDAAFAQLLERAPRSSLAPGAVYWRARIAGRLGDAASEQAGLRKVTRSWPVSGYAWFASQRLGAPAAAEGASDAPRPAPVGAAELETGFALARVGLRTWAADALRTHGDAAKGASAADRQGLAWGLIEAGAYTSAQALVRSACSPPGRGDPAVQPLCWPRPLGAALDPIIDTYALPTHLPFAIMTAESALKPEVTSIAGARGLMQLMPALAEQHYAEVFPGRAWHPDHLYDPGINARLGTHELGTLMAAFGSREVQPALPMVIAGYNAGTAAVERWLEAAGPGVEADVWAENIGYTETRRYVRRVLGYLRAYELIYGP